jgi:hypothetical protein
MAYMDQPGPAPTNPVVERLLPSLLHVKAAAILDHALKAWATHQNISIPTGRPYGDSLYRRINYLADQGHLTDRTMLHDIRNLRNALAHQPAENVDWAALDRDIAAINATLQELQIVGPMPTWEIIAERSAMQAGAIPDAVWTVNYSLAIKQDGQTIAEIPWQVHTMRSQE